MDQATEEIVRAAYRAFNARDLESAVALMHPDVNWPNAWEGGRVVGREAVGFYWRRQFEQISSEVEPEALVEEPDGVVTVGVHQVFTRPGRADCSQTPRFATATGSRTA